MASWQPLAVHLFAGGTDALPTLTLLYDFDSEAAGSDNPLVLVEAEPLPSKYGVNMKLYRRMEQQSHQRE